MEFLSGKIDELKKELKNTDLPPKQKNLFQQLTDLTAAVLQQQDLLTARILELEEQCDQATERLNDLQLQFLQNFDLDECGMPQRQTKIGHSCDCGHPHSHGDECDCEDCDPERPDDFYTLQCPFCEELFFIERDELDLDVECPFCNKTLKAAENIVKP